MSEVKVLSYDTTRQPPRTVLRVIVIILGSFAIFLAASIAYEEFQLAMHAGLQGLGLQADLTALIGLLAWWGVGAIRSRRWVRPVAMSAIKPIAFLDAIFFVVMLAPICDLLTSQFSDNGVAVALIMFLGSMLGAAVAACLGVFLFFRMRRVELMLATYDRDSSWLDERPIPLLSISFSLVLDAAMFVFGSAPPTWHPDMTLGRLAPIVWPACAVVSMTLAVGVLLSQQWAWWGTLFFTLATWGLQLAYILKMDWSAGGAIYLWSCELIFAGVAIGYLIWARRFFPTNLAIPDSASK